MFLDSLERILMLVSWMKSDFDIACGTLDVILDSGPKSDFLEAWWMAIRFERDFVFSHQDGLHNLLNRKFRLLFGKEVVAKSCGVEISKRLGIFLMLPSPCSNTE